MDAEQFDRLARTFVARRAVMRTLFGVAIGAGVGLVENADTAAKRSQRRKGKRRRRHQGDRMRRRRSVAAPGRRAVNVAPALRAASARAVSVPMRLPHPPVANPPSPAAMAAPVPAVSSAATTPPASRAARRTSPAAADRAARAVSPATNIPAADICEPCGFSRTPCCPGGTCRQGTCVPIPNHPAGVVHLREECGGVDQPCCHGDVQACGVQALCVAGTCVACGRTGDPCCAGNTCHRCRICNG